VEESRARSRSRVLHEARIILDPASPIVPCTLHDLTNAGACLSPVGNVELPERFELTFDRGRSSRSCRVCWRTGDKLGVAFEKAGGLGG